MQWTLIAWGLPTPLIILIFTRRFLAASTACAHPTEAGGEGTALARSEWQARKRGLFWAKAFQGYAVYCIAVTLEFVLISLPAFWLLPDPIDILVTVLLTGLAALGTAVYLFLRTKRVETRSNPGTRAPIATTRR